MEQNILGTDPQTFEKRIKLSRWICMAVSMTAVGLNVLLCCLRNDDNHELLLTLNIAVDILCVWFLMLYAGVFLSERRRQLKLYKGRWQCLQGCVTEITEETQRNQGFDCRRITVDAGEQRALLLCDNGNIQLQCGKSYVFNAVSNIIVEVTDGE